MATFKDGYELPTATFPQWLRESRLQAMIGLLTSLALAETFLRE
ncbi:MAG: hypothetical protein ACM37W_04355 [Actinomycetota bacterium]